MIHNFVTGRNRYIVRAKILILIILPVHLASSPAVLYPSSSIIISILFVCDTRGDIVLIRQVDLYHVHLGISAIQASSWGSDSDISRRSANWIFLFRTALKFYEVSWCHLVQLSRYGAIWQHPPKSSNKLLGQEQNQSINITSVRSCWISKWYGWLGRFIDVIGLISLPWTST